ncbi:MAG: alpha-glucosidase/alpha-galactosidase [Oscillospiraceae bacterium]|nr:alpha-glucosidase/alpha-galactosidase [Oscillospiraceae bacterium]
MKFVDNKVEGLKIAYIGGGSRDWGWTLMNDLVTNDDMTGDVYLYDIDYQAAKDNEVIGAKYNCVPEAKSKWGFHAVKTLKEALEGANFVVISILPGTFDEMESDVHTPEKYGIYQSVGDTSGPGGIVRAMRTIPMYEVIAEAIKNYSPDAWVINYTNPMTLCVKTLYRVFPEIKAFGCCHEVFGTQKLLCTALDDLYGIKAERDEIKINPVSVNHFTWITKAQYRDMDLFPVYAEFAKKYEEGYVKDKEENWFNSYFANSDKVKFNLFNKYGYIAAAGDRHLAEFNDGMIYLKDPETVRSWGFGLTPVSWRKEHRAEKIEDSRAIRAGEKEIEIRKTGEEGVNQMKALLGLHDLVTNVNIPNLGQIPNLPIGAVVETNAVFRADSVTPLMAGNIPTEIHPLVSRICAEQELVSEAVAKRDIQLIFNAFVTDPLVTCSYEDAKKLFKEMVLNTKEYLGDYDLTALDNLR